MWIMTQDKDRTVNAEKADVIVINCKAVYAEYGDNSRCRLGLYNSDETARSVLKDIVNAQFELRNVYVMPGFERR